jgi:NAD(P)H-hydrate epimerase
MGQEREKLEQVVVNAEQMTRIESRLFEAGMPVAALMEKVAGLITTRVVELYPCPQFSRVGVIVGPGNNGGDALVVARELHLQGYEVRVCRPLDKLKELPSQHASYARSLGIPFFENLESLHSCDVIIDGLFGFGLTRPVEGNLAQLVNQLNGWSQPIVSIDLPSGIHTDTGEVLGTAIRATHTFCLGLWKPAFLQDQALAYTGEASRIDFGIPPGDVWAIISQPSQMQRLTAKMVREVLPLRRPKMTHKYKQGHLLLIGGSRRYAGGIILTALGARATGVGMLSVAVPESLKPLLVSQLPEALIIGCRETEAGVMAELPTLASDWENYSAIAIGPGITPQATKIFQATLAAAKPLVIDADGLNILAQLGTAETLAKRESPTILTPHPGEFKRLFRDAPSPTKNQIKAAQVAAKKSNSIVVLKGARSIVARPDGAVWLVPQSSPALARGGSGDVLTGLIGGLIAPVSDASIPLEALVAAATWWHAQAGILGASERTEMGLDAFTLSQYLVPVLNQLEAR